MKKKILLYLLVIFLTGVSNAIDLSLSVAHAKKQPRCTTSADCDDNNMCTDDQCKGKKCKYTYNTDPCDDAIGCTENDVCSGGSCNGSSNNSLCDDGNLCTDDLCSIGVGCSNPNNSDLCNDGIACTENDVCSGGSCNGSPNNSICDDGLWCNGSESCNVITDCQPGTNPCPDTECNTCQEDTDSCFDPAGTQCADDGNICSDDLCNGAGACIHPNNNDPCDDGTYCTESDMCSNGVCTGSPNDDLCNDSNVCTYNICTLGVGCSNPVMEFTISLSPGPITLDNIGEHKVITAYVQENSLASEGVEVSFAESNDPDNAIQPLPMAELDLNGAAAIKIHGISVGLGLLSIKAVDENGDDISDVNYTLGEPIDNCATLDEPTQTLAIVSLPCDTEMTVICNDSTESPIAGYLISSIDPSSAVTGEVVLVTNTSGEARVFVAGTAEGQATVSASEACNAATDETSVTVLDILVTDDSDGDGVLDLEDNCPDAYNPNQEDTYPPQKNGIGDACECEADFNCDGNVDTADMTSFLDDFGRSNYFNPCSANEPCYGDFDCDVNVDTDDVTLFLEDFGRSQYYNPCPACEAEDWCVYP